MELATAASCYEDYYIIEKNLSTNTYLGYQNDINLFLTYLKEKGITKTEEVDHSHILVFIAYRSSLVSEKTLNREKSVVKNFLLYCLVMGYISEDFSDLLCGESKDQFFPSVLTREEMEQLFKFIENKKKKTTPKKSLLLERDYLMLEMLYALGLRVSELIGIRLSDIDKSGWCQIHGKGDKVRRVPLLTRTVERISFYLDNIRPQLLPPINQTFSTNIEKDYLFLNRSGRQLSRVAVWKWVKEISRQVKITKNISPHTFRHTCATHLLQNGADLRVIQELVGHSNIQTTELYTHLLTEDVKRIFADHHPLYQ